MALEICPISADLSCGLFPAVPEAETCKGSGGKQLFKNLVLKGACARGLFLSFLSVLRLIQSPRAKGPCHSEHVLATRTCCQRLACLSLSLDKLLQRKEYAQLNKI